MRTLPLGYQPNFIVINTDDAPLNIYDNLPLTQAAWLASSLDYTRNGSANGPLCAPGRAATLSGLRMEHHKVWDNSSGANFDFSNTFLTALRSRGYRTGAVGKWMNGFGESGGGGFGSQVRQRGLDYQRIIYGNPNYFDYDILDETGALTHYGKSQADGGSNANYATRVEETNVLAFLNSVPPNQPFCLYWGAKAPHKDSGSGPTPYPPDANAAVTNIPSPSFGQDPKVWGNPDFWSVSAGVWDAAAIAACVAEHKLAIQTLLDWDRAFNAMMLNLQAAGRLANTFIFLKTDNAHAYGELRQSDKGTPHRSASSMLLRVWCPTGMGVSGSRKAAVSDIDIAPTLCHLAGATMPRAPDGMSMYPTFLDNDANFRVAAPLDNPVKDSPTFRGLWYATGRVWYEGLPGGKADKQFGGWDDKDQMQDIGWQKECHDDLLEITNRTYVMP